MANPNKSAKGCKPERRESEEARAARMRGSNADLFSIMDAVSRGEITPEEAAKRISAINPDQ